MCSTTPGLLDDVVDTLDLPGRGDIAGLGNIYRVATHPQVVSPFNVGKIYVLLWDSDLREIRKIQTRVADVNIPCNDEEALAAGKPSRPIHQ